MQPTDYEAVRVSICPDKTSPKTRDETKKHFQQANQLGNLYKKGNV